jgi:hypothetical protein
MIIIIFFVAEPSRLLAVFLLRSYIYSTVKTCSSDFFPYTSYVAILLFMLRSSRGSSQKEHMEIKMRVSVLYGDMDAEDLNN